MMEWTGKQRKQLRKVLLDTFRNSTQLRMFLRDELDIALVKIVDQENLEGAVFETIEEAISKQWIDRLLAAFRKEYPQRVSELDRLVQQVQTVQQSVDQLAAAIEAEAHQKHSQNPRNKRRGAEAIAREIAEQDSPNIDEVLHQVDLNEVMEIVTGIFRRSKKPRTALLIVDNSTTMFGESCRLRIQDSLKLTRAPIPIDPIATQRPPTTAGILECIAEPFNLFSEFSNADGETQCASIVIKGICDELHDHASIMFAIEQWDLLIARNPGLLQEFMDIFWCPFLEFLCTSSKHGWIKICAIIDSPKDLSLSCNIPDELCCKPKTFEDYYNQQFDSRRPLLLPLKNWSKDDITECLTRPELKLNLDLSRTSNEAEKIYVRSKSGEPLAANTLLRKFLETALNS